MKFKEEIHPEILIVIPFGIVVIILLTLIYLK